MSHISVKIFRNHSLFPAQRRIAARAEKNFSLPRKKFFSAQVKMKVVQGSLADLLAHRILL